MSEYVHFTAEQKKAARETDLVAFLERQGEKVKRAGSEYEWMDGDAKVSIRGNPWFHQYDREGGDAIDFVKRFYEKNYPQALELLLGQGGECIRSAPPQPKKENTGEFILPEQNGSMRRVYSYLLKTRGLDKEVVTEFVKRNMLYESKPYHNAVFVGYDAEGKARHASLRGTYAKPFKGNVPNSSPEYSFHLHGTSAELFVFEAPIDMLSFISMHKNGWQEHSYAACCGVSDQVLFRMMKDNPCIKRVNLCLDNDKGGKMANRRIADKLFVREIPSRTLIPKHKDWNEDLLARRSDHQMQTQRKEVKAVLPATEEEISRPGDASAEGERSEEEQCPVLAQS